MGMGREAASRSNETPKEEQAQVAVILVVSGDGMVEIGGLVDAHCLVYRNTKPFHEGGYIYLLSLNYDLLKNRHQFRAQSGGQPDVKGGSGPLRGLFWSSYIRYLIYLPGTLRLLAGSFAIYLSK